MCSYADKQESIALRRNFEFMDFDRKKRELAIIEKKSVVKKK